MKKPPKEAQGNIFHRIVRPFWLRPTDLSFLPFKKSSRRERSISCFEWSILLSLQSFKDSPSLPSLWKMLLHSLFANLLTLLPSPKKPWNLVPAGSSSSSSLFLPAGSLAPPCHEHFRPFGPINWGKARSLQDLQALSRSHSSIPHLFLLSIRPTSYPGSCCMKTSQASNFLLLSWFLGSWPMKKNALEFQGRSISGIHYFLIIFSIGSQAILLKKKPNMPPCCKTASWIWWSLLLAWNPIQRTLSNVKAFSR